MRKINTTKESNLQLPFVDKYCKQHADMIYCSFIEYYLFEEYASITTKHKKIAITETVMTILIYKMKLQRHQLLFG